MQTKASIGSRCELPGRSVAEITGGLSTRVKRKDAKFPYVSLYRHFEADDSSDESSMYVVRESNASVLHTRIEFNTSLVEHDSGTFDRS